MAVIVSDSNNGSYDGNLSTANGFYRAEASNIGMWGSTRLVLTTTRTIAVTFANSGNSQGLILAIEAGNSTNTIATNYRDVTVKLQENVASVWTDRATKTLTGVEMYNNATYVNWFSNSNNAPCWVIPFKFATPYAITTAGSTWRFEISLGASGGSKTLSSSIRTSDNTNPFYIAWCDNAVSYTDNTDQIIAMDSITIDRSATLKGALGTGDTTRSICGIACRNTDPTVANVANIVWENAPAASYTLTIDGWLVISAHAGFRVGTSSSRIPFAQQAIIDIISATSGTNTNTGIVSSCAFENSNLTKTSFFAYGEIPTLERTTLASDAAAAQKDIVTSVATGWSIGDSIWVGKQTTKGSTDTSFRTISNIVGTTITLSSNLSGGGRKAGGPVFKFGGYGVRINSPSGVATSKTLNFCAPSNFVLSGVQNHNVTTYSLSTGGSGLITADESANSSQILIEHCSYYPRNINGSNGLIDNVSIPVKGMLVDNNNFAGTTGVNSYSVTGGYSGTLTISNNYICSVISVASVIGSGIVAVINNNFLTDSIISGTHVGFFTINGVNITHTNNVYWGCQMSANSGAVRTGDIVNTLDWSGNSYDNSDGAISFNGITNNVKIVNDSFGQTTANSNDLLFSGGVYLDVEISSPTGAVTLQETNIPIALDGSLLKISAYNDTPTNDKGYLPVGYYQRTGSGLSDTTTYVSGGYALRLQPTSGTTLLTWPNRKINRIVPTGNIQNKTMTVTTWIYINNTAYDAGTYVMPTLNVKYDDATTVTSVATATFSSWQQLAVSFTPSTTFGQIEVWISGATDASGSNAYFYIGTLVPNFPAGVIVDNTQIQNWAGALPVWPTTANIANPANMWDELEANHTVSGSFGAAVTETKVKTDDNTALILTK